MKKKPTKKKPSPRRAGARKRPVSRQVKVVTQLVQRENERLTRLLRNLYQEFRLGEGERSQLYEHICQELAQYFRCDCCQLYLVEQRPSGGEVLSLVAAFGPWEAALKPRYVRRIIPIEYPLDSDSQTAQRFREEVAHVDLSRVDYRVSSRDVPLGRSRRNRGSRGLTPEPEWHVVWPRDNLYNVSRNIISCPILRHRSRGQWKPYPVGVIKLENRRPFYSKAFEFNYEARKLYFGAYFELCSVAGYVRDLYNRLKYADSPDSLSSPMHDGDGWRQHFQVHQAGEPYYQIVQAWHKEKLATYWKGHGEGALKSAKADLKGQYKEVSKKLSTILDIVVESEVFLQALQVALLELNNEAKSQPQKNDLGSTPIPSFFNVIDLAKAGTRTKRHLSQVREAIYVALERTCKMDCDPQHAKRTSKMKCDPQHAERTCRVLARACCPPRKRRRNEDESKGKKNGLAKTERLWNKLTERFEENGPSLSGLLEKSGRQVFADEMYGFISKVAALILDKRPPAGVVDLAPEVLSSYQCAKSVLDIVQSKSKAQAVSKHPSANAAVKLENSIRRFAATQAKACMYAHTFDPQVDGARLYSIQSHVSQIIDNHLMERMRDLEISFDHLELLGLTDSSVEQLELLDKLLQDSVRRQEMAVHFHLTNVRYGSGTALERYSVEARPHSIRDILDELIKPMRGKIEKGQRFLVPWFEVHLRPKNVQKDSETHDTEVKIRNALRRYRFKNPLKPASSFETQELFQDGTEDAPNAFSRPVPKWLFALNRDLAAFCRGERTLRVSTDQNLDLCS